MEKYNYGQWKQFMEEIKYSTEQTEELSKLYIIIHQKVKKTLHKSTTNPQQDTTPEIDKHITFINDILQKLAHREQDEYLSKMTIENLQRYSKHLNGLVQMLENTKSIINNRKDIDQLKFPKSNTIKRYLKETQGKASNEDAKKNIDYTLKGELKKSNERRIKNKYGNFKISSNILISSSENVQKQKVTKSMIRQKRASSTDLIERIGTQVNFRKKYNNIQKYLAQKKDFQQLYNYSINYNKMMKQANLQRNQLNEDVNKAKSSKNLKIFSQFNVKTKFIKEGVKKNIINIILSVKKELLQEIHLKNLQKMNDINEAQLIEIKKNKPKIIRPRNFSSTLLQNPTEYNKKQSTSQTKKTTLTLYPQLKSDRFHSARQNKAFKGNWWNQSVDLAYKEKLSGRFNTNKFQEYR